MLKKIKDNKESKKTKKIFVLIFILSLVNLLVAEEMLSKNNAQDNIKNNIKDGMYGGVGIMMVEQIGKIIYTKEKSTTFTREENQYAAHFQFGYMQYIDYAQEHAFKYSFYLGGIMNNPLFSGDTQEINGGRKKYIIRYNNFKLNFSVKYSPELIYYKTLIFGVDIGAMFEINYYSGIKIDSKILKTLFSFTHGVQPLIGMYFYIRNKHLIEIGIPLSFISTSKGEKQNEGGRVEYIANNYGILSYSHRF